MAQPSSVTQSGRARPPDGRIFAILRMDPSPTALYGPLGPFRYALEARAGFFASQGIRAGEGRLLLTP